MNLKLILPASLLLNVAAAVLFGRTIFIAPPALVKDQPQEANGRDSSQAAVASQVASMPSVAARPAPEPQFTWDKVDSPDFPTYINGLRRIGCPESTIQDIVRGELGEIYHERRQTAQQISRSSSPARAQAAADLAKIDKEQAAMFERVFAAAGTQGAATGGTLQAYSDIPDSTPEEPSATVRGPDWPLAYKDMDVVYAKDTPGSLAATTPKGAVALTSAQLDALGKARNDFDNDIAGDAQDPESPEYLDTWKRAQAQNDEGLRDKIGWEAYNQVGLAAARKAAAERRKATLAP